MQHRKLWYWTIAIFIMIIAVVLYFFFLAPSADSLVPQPINNTKDYSALNQQIVKDLNYQHTAASIVRKVDDYYEFSLSSIDGSSGGIELIAHMKSDGLFEKIWDGQDIPPCRMIGFEVPAGIAPYCYKNTVVVDRSNLVRTLYTILFNPYVDKYGQVVYP